MNKITLILVLVFIFSSSAKADFLTEQNRYERVRTSIKDKQRIIEKKLTENQITIDNLNLLIVAYKNSDRLDIYAKKKQKSVYKKIISYKICSRSGKLGPKRKHGDKQVPEGFYHIDRFNPASKFYLSLGINYPNLSDKRKSKANNLGDNIFIHGSCSTIGCLPMTNNYIKEIYLLAVYAKNSGQSKIPVYIFPFEMTDKNFANHVIRHKKDVELINFWKNLKVGYDKFMKDGKELNIKVNKNGDYVY